MLAQREGDQRIHSGKTALASLEVGLQRGERPVLPVVADQTGSPTSAADIAAAIRSAVQQIAAGNTNWGTCQKPILRSTFGTG